VIVAAAGTQMVLEYVRRPLLSISKKRAISAPHPSLRWIAHALSLLSTERSRKLAAAAVARAAPVLLGDVHGVREHAQADALEALDAAIAAAREVDVHRLALDARPRSALRADRLEAEARGDDERLEELALEETAVTDASIAHDLAVRRCLESCGWISRALSTRTV